MSLLMDALKKVEKKAETTMDTKSEAPTNLLMDALQKTETQSSKPKLPKNHLEVLKPVTEKTVETKPEKTTPQFEQADSSLMNEDEELQLVEIDNIDTEPEISTPPIEHTIEQKSDSSPINQEEEDELFLFEIENDEELKTIRKNPISDSTSNDWEEELLPGFKEVDSQAETNAKDNSNQTDNFSSPNEQWNPENPFSAFQDDNTKHDFSSHNWEDEILPQFQNTENKSDKLGASEIEPFGSSINEIEPSNSNDSFSEVEPFDGKRENDNEAELTPPKTSAHNFHPTNELNSPLSGLKEAPLDFTLEKEQPLELKTKPKISDGKHLPLEMIIEESPRIQPEKAKRVLAANTPPPTSKRTLWLSGILGILLLTMGAGYYYYSHLLTDNSFSSVKIERRLSIMDSTQASQASTSYSNLAETTVSQPSPVHQESTPTPIPSPTSPSPTSIQSSVQLVSEPNQVVNLVKNTKPKPSENSVGTQVTVSSASAPKLRKSKTTQTVSPKPAKSAQSPREEKYSKQSTKTMSVKNPRSDNKHPVFSAQVSSNSTSKAQQQTKLLAPKSSSSIPGIYTLRKNITTKINPELSKAYQAFQRGDDKAAQKAYHNALRQDQDNRNALLGLAAIAIRNGNQQQAQQYYRRVLQLNPQDTYAQVGLINTLDSHSLKSESQLKLILERTPKAAYIHFSLGNIYASKRQWTQAQQAYFNAYRYDNNQADYAYNLAVSLDYLNQPRQALSYYQRALKLAKNQAVNFNLSVAQKRVQTLLATKKAKASALANLPND